MTARAAYKKGKLRHFPGVIPHTDQVRMLEEKEPFTIEGLPNWTVTKKQLKDYKRDFRNQVKKQQKTRQGREH